MIKEVLQQLEPLDAQIDALCSSADDAEMTDTTTHAAELAELSAQENMLLQRCTSLTPEDRVFLARRPAAHCARFQRNIHIATAEIPHAEFFPRFFYCQNFGMCGSVMQSVSQIMSSRYNLSVFDYYRTDRDFAFLLRL